MKTTLLFTASLLIIFTVTEAQNPCLPEGITFTTQAQIDSFQVNFPGCTEIEGDVWINGWEISNLEGLSAVTSIGGWFEIFQNNALTSLVGLEGLTSTNGFNIQATSSLTSLIGLEGLTHVGSHFFLIGNHALVNLTGLENLTTIEGGLMIGYFPLLYGWANPVLKSLMGLEGLTYVGDFVSIMYCDSLTNLVGLENLTSIGGGLSIDYNDALTSLTGMENIDAASISSLYIRNNNSLSSCHVQSICEYLATPNGTVTIENNAPGCNNVGQVEDACGIVGNIEKTSSPTITIHPNPTNNGSITIILENPHSLSLALFNTYGQQVHQQEITGTETVINVSTWSPGIYLAVVYEDGKAMGRSKFVVR